MSVHILKDTESRGLQALSDRLKRLNKRILVGVPAGKVEPDGTSTALVAAVVEFGTADGKIPERPFLRNGLRHSYPAITRYNAPALRAVAEGTLSAEVALATTGELAVAGVKKEMVSGEFVPNAESTIKKKGSDRPTIDTAQLRQSITYVVEEGAL
jgi:hypothetical protein